MKEGPKYVATELLPTIFGGACCVGTHVRASDAAHVLRCGVAFEDVLEVRREGVVHVEEVRHVDDVVDDFTAVGVDGRGVPDPVAPLVAERAFDAGDSHVVGRRVALGVVPDEEHAVLVEGLPGARLGQRGDAACVRNLLALAVAAPAPIVERTGNGVALDGALAQVATHVTAVRVEDLDVAFTVGEDDQFGAERLDGVRLAVLEGLRESNAVPSTRKACRARFQLGSREPRRCRTE